MPKAAGPGKCVHCLKEVEERNWDHVLPVSWYPETTPRDLEKWKVPGCIECNRKYGVVEEEILTSIGLCLDPDHPDTSDIVAKVLRSMKSAHGKNDKDRKARERKAKSVINRTTVFKEIPSHGIFPNFGPQAPPEPEGYRGILISRSNLEKIAEKIVRGVAYVEDQIYIDDNYELDLYVLEDEGAAPVVEIIDRYGIQLHRGPALLVRRAVIEDDKQAGLYAIEIWGRLKLYATVTPKNADEVKQNNSDE